MRSSSRGRAMTYFAVAACAMFVVPLAYAQSASNDPLVGNWNLVSATQTVNGKTQDYFGPQPLGQIIFTPDGHFSDIVIRSDLDNFQARNRTAGTPEENAAVVKGSIAFFGTYKLVGDTFVHVWGDQFTWENAAGSGGGDAKLVFQRIR